METLYSRPDSTQSVSLWPHFFASKLILEWILAPVMRRSLTIIAKYTIYLDLVHSHY